MVNSKNAFWQAFVFAVIVFAMGMILGLFLEDFRTNEIEKKLLESELNLLDEQIRGQGINNFQIECSEAKKSTFEFADKIYREAITLEKYDANSKFKDDLLILHKRYDLLRMLLWSEGIELKNNCAEELHTLVYLFSYEDEETQTKALQASHARLLNDFKEKNGDNVLLIPIAANLDISSVELIKNKYKIDNLPAIIVDEEKVITGQFTFEQLEDIVFEKSNYENLENSTFETINTTHNPNKIFLN